MNYGIDFYSNWSLFKVENSKYLKWFKEESSGIFEKLDLNIEHYVFFTPDEVIEILSSYPPEVEIK